MADAGEADPKRGMLRAELVAEEAPVKVFGQGFCDQQMIDLFLAQLKAAIAAQRRTGPVRVLADGRELLAQSAEVVDRMQRETGRLYRAGDRVAVLVSSALFKMQLQRSVRDDFRRLFVSEEEARTWLFVPEASPVDALHRTAAR